MPSQPQRVRGSISFMPPWYTAEFGLRPLDPFAADLDGLVEADLAMARRLHAKYPDLPLGSAEPEGIYPLLRCGEAFVICNAYGAPAPVWDGVGGMFWHDREHPPWGGVRSVEDVRSIRLPDWPSVPLVQQMRRAWDDAARRTRFAQPPRTAAWGFTHPRTGRSYRFQIFASFIDIGNSLCGSEFFLATLAGEPDLADALLDKVFEVSTSYTDFLRTELGRESVEGLSSFGGDYSCFLSPELYRRYAIGFDKRLVARYGNLPANLHSCGPSQHLYEVWAEYENPIVFMQTRGYPANPADPGRPGALARLRRVLPETQLQITLHAPQFPFEDESPESIRQAMWQLAEEAGGRDLTLAAIVTRSGPEIDRNIRAFYRTLDEINGT